jgi:hypothetical protein
MAIAKPILDYERGYVVRPAGWLSFLIPPMLRELVITTAAVAATSATASGAGG